MKMLSIQLGGHRGCLGLSLRGNCTTPADAHQLEHATQRMLIARNAQLWIDCQRLQSLSVLGQRALVQADRNARAVGTTCYWCGLPEHMRARLGGGGADNALHLLPAEGFQGPRFLLPKG